MFEIVENKPITKSKDPARSNDVVPSANDHQIIGIDKKKYFLRQLFHVLEK